jgi:hypothetical protein
MAERSPNFAEYQRKTERLIPVIVLDRSADGSGSDLRAGRRAKGPRFVVC